MTAAAPPAFVPLDDYVRGSLPDVSVMSGKPTDHRVSVASPVPDEAAPGDGVMAVLPDGLASALTARLKQPVVLRGRLPVAPEEEARLRRRTVASRATVALATVGLVTAATAAQPWSPVAAVAALVALAVALVSLRRLRRAWPQALLDADKGWVAVAPVHPDFAAAARERFGAPPRP